MEVKPIGIFDSGLGGLTVWKACKELLPQESFIYVADQAFCPYGPKSQELIHERAHKITDFFREQGVQLVIIACNTATAAAIQDLRDSFDLPFVGMEPAIKPAAENSQTGNIGILATQGTFDGNHFKKTKSTYAAHLEVHIQVGEGLVEVVEAGQLEAPSTYELLKQYLLPMKSARVDQLVLGCTHYPLLREHMEKILGDQVNIIDPAPAVAKQVKRLLPKLSIASDSLDRFYTTALGATTQMSLEKLAPLLEKAIQFEEIHIPSEKFVC
ncbi:MAG: glutamate racemase [Bacteroidota bacterium]